MKLPRFKNRYEQIAFFVGASAFVIASSAALVLICSMAVHVFHCNHWNYAGCKSVDLMPHVYYLPASWVIEGLMVIAMVFMNGALMPPRLGK